MLVSISVLIFIASMVAAPPASGPQGQQDDAAYKAERRRAIELFMQNKHLEALPLFADLAKKNPTDHEVLLGLAGCMISEASSRDDDKAAAERVQARQLLLKAKELGNTSALLENLLQTIPEDGVIHYSDSPADQAMRAGEAAFSRSDLAEAIRQYSKVLELEPNNATAALFVGDAYFAGNNFAQAAEWYERSIKINPDRETAYRYYSDMLTKQGQMEKARTMAIRAVIAEPYNPITWRGLGEWARANQLQLVRMHMDIPSSVTQSGERNLTINVDPAQPKEAMGVWLSYSLARAAWSGEKFKKVFPQEKEYRHSLAEESDALTSAATVWKELNEADKKPASTLPGDPLLLTLVKLHRSGMIEPYVLLNAADAGIAQDYAAYREKNRGKLEEYLSTFVVPPAPVK